MRLFMMAMREQELADLQGAGAAKLALFAESVRDGASIWVMYGQTWQRPSRTQFMVAGIEPPAKQGADFRVRCLPVAAGRPSTQKLDNLWRSTWEHDTKPLLVTCETVPASWWVVQLDHDSSSVKRIGQERAWRAVDHDTGGLLGARRLDSGRVECLTGRPPSSRIDVPGWRVTAVPCGSVPDGPDPDLLDLLR